jgi:hypothetical protein
MAFCLSCTLLALCAVCARRANVQRIYQNIADREKYTARHVNCLGMAKWMTYTRADIKLLDFDRSFCALLSYFYIYYFC